MKVLPCSFLLLLLLISSPAYAQADDEEAIKTVIKTLFDGLTAQDSTMMMSVTDPGGRLVMTGTSDGQPFVRAVSMPQFIKIIVEHEGEVMVEKYWNLEISIEENLATVWNDYAFYVGETLDHCGKDTFQLARTVDGWKIIAIADTQRREGCEDPPDEQ